VGLAHRLSAALGLGAVLLAFGDHFGLYRPAYDLVRLTLFRIPRTSWRLAGFAVAILAGLGAEALVAGRHRAAWPESCADWRSWPESGSCR
jgi:hypothetical protein